MSGVSVVMSVYDEPEHVKKTIDSVLKQTGIDFEFIIVSDGASDSVVNVVKGYLTDQRLRFIEQENQGLTVALINGCNQARWPFIARIDAGDTMHPSRLLTQFDVLSGDEMLGFVASWVRVETQEGYFLYDVKLQGCELELALKSVQPEEIVTPFHASVMFRKSIYDQVGGYRSEFYFSQDCDLWSRMIEKSGVKVVQELLTNGLFSANGISGRHAQTQLKMKALVAQANRLRQSAKSDESILVEAAKLRPSKQPRSVKEHEDEFSGIYFIARVLSNNRSSYAKKYWSKALRIKPFSLKALFFYSISLLYNKSK